MVNYLGVCQTLICSFMGDLKYGVVNLHRKSFQFEFFHSVSFFEFFTFCIFLKFFIHGLIFVRIHDQLTVSLWSFSLSLWKVVIYGLSVVESKGEFGVGLTVTRGPGVELRSWRTAVPLWKDCCRVRKSCPGVWRIPGWWVCLSQPLLRFCNKMMGLRSRVRSREVVSWFWTALCPFVKVKNWKMVAEEALSFQLGAECRVKDQGVQRSSGPPRGVMDWAISSLFPTGSEHFGWETVWVRRRGFFIGLCYQKRRRFIVSWTIFYSDHFCFY